MPTYEYKCLECNNLFEVFQSMSSVQIKVCPECGGNVKRLIGAGAGPIFKGTGFYQTDYKNKGKSDNDNQTSKGKPAPQPKEKPTVSSEEKSSKKNTDSDSK
jgi:putative FmdB family regulatory protein